MKKLVFPLIFLVFGAVAGAGGGFAYRQFFATCEKEECMEKEDKAEPKEEQEELKFIAMQNQFVVPIVRGEKVSALVVLSLSLAVKPNSDEAIFAKEPKLRDAFLSVMFDHAHVGGFDGAFTESERLTVLRVALLETANAIVGPLVSDILITDIVRQEM